MDSLVVSKSVNKDSKDSREKEKKSSSKHKEKEQREKEKDRDEKKSSKKHSKSRKSESPTPSKRRHRSRSRDSGDSENEDEKEPPKKSKQSKKDDSPIGGSGGGGDVSLSIEETNKLRAKLGLKPLSLDDGKEKKKPVAGEEGDKQSNKYIDKKTYEEFEHRPAVNMAEQKEQKEFRKKLEEHREKRRLMERMMREKEEGEAEDDEDESAVEWIKKIREREEAKKKAAMLEEMDKQFEDEAANVTSKPDRPKRATTYNEANLKGFKVEHDIKYFREGQDVILTLKDRSILRGQGENLELDEDEDALVNVNIADDERAAKFVELRKKKPDYNPYDDFDEDGNFKVKGILDKYDEELMGEKKKSFKLGDRGVYDVSDEKFIEKLNEEHRSRAIKLNATDFKLANDYFTAEEMEKFKKPKKVRKVLRSKTKTVKADDLLPLEETPAATAVKPRNTDRAKATVESTNDTNEVKKVSLKGIDFGLDKKDSDDEEDGEAEDDGEVKSEPKDEDEQEEEEDEDDDDFIDTNKLNNKKDDEELRKILDEENEELHAVLSKTRKRVIAPLVLDIKTEETEADENGVDFDKLQKTGDDDMVLDTISEFCRNIKSEPVRGGGVEEEDEDDEERKTAARSRRKDDMEVDDDDDDEEEKAVKKDESMSPDNRSNEEQTKEEENNGEEEETNILDAEPIIDRGCMSAILLATNKGYLTETKAPQSSRPAGTKPAGSSISAANYTIEERTYYDIDDKYNRNSSRNDRYTSGPLVDFEEKRGYKPDVKLDYIDEKGHSMNEKEAFRYLSHRFHGKGPGKIKTEKRLKKHAESEAMNKMSSVDTPLNTVALLQEKQKKLQQPYVVLSARSKKDQPDHIGK